jgi:lipopolysaccharide transport system ATP-binding protein
VSSVSIRIQGLGKRYRVGSRERYKALRDTLSGALQAPWRGLRAATQRASVAPSKSDQNGYIWALKDVDLEVEDGQVLGIIGQNGAGKTTLLKILSRITEPTEGRAELRGTVGSLLEVGTGFHPELTGRENIYLSGAILGMPKVEIQRNFDRIVEFAGIELFLDTPVKRYSSGMYMRLAFAVAAHLETSILLLDEVIAVGDHAFQTKCLNKMQDVGSSGRTILFVSHNLAAIRAICPTVVWIDGGHIRAHGPAPDVVEAYITAGGVATTDGDLTHHPGRLPGKPPILQRVSILARDGTRVSSVPVGGTLRLAIDLALDAPMRRVQTWALIDDAAGDRLVTMGSHFADTAFGERAGEYTVICEVPRIPLVPGRYSVTLWLEHGKEKIDVVERAIAFDLVAADFFGTGILEGGARGKILLESTWAVAEPAVSVASDRSAW